LFGTSELHGNGAHQVRDAAFRRGIGDRGFPPLEPGGRADIHHHAAAALRDHLFSGPFAGEKLAGQRHRDGPVEIRLGAFTDGEVVRNGDVVDQDVESAERLDRGGDHRLDRFLVRDVRPDIDRGAGTGLVDRLGRASAAHLVEIDHRHLRALVGKEYRRLLSDISPRSGNDRDLVLEFHGVPCLSKRLRAKRLRAESWRD
jgi:hypothetical protein